MRILIVDDDFVSRKIVMHALKDFGWFDVAVNGAEACAAFKLAHESGEPYELVCMDVMMPEMNGQDAVKAMREIERTCGVDPAKEARIVMISCVSDQKEVCDAFFHGHASLYLTKPIEPIPLREKIAALLGRTE